MFEKGQDRLDEVDVHKIGKVRSKIRKSTLEKYVIIEIQI